MLVLHVLSPSLHPRKHLLSPTTSYLPAYRKRSAGYSKNLLCFMWKIKFQSKPGFYCIFARKYVKNYVFFSDFFAQKETLTDWRDISDNVHGKTTYNQRTATCNCSVGEALYSQVSCSWRVPDECVNRVVWSLKGRAHIGVICSSTFLSKDRHWRISNGKKQTINLIVFLPSENTSRGPKMTIRCQISTLCSRKWFPKPKIDSQSPKIDSKWFEIDS